MILTRLRVIVSATRQQTGSVFKLRIYRALIQKRNIFRVRGVELI
jgi:hypothetical protein